MPLFGHREILLLMPPTPILWSISWLSLINMPNGRKNAIVFLTPLIAILNMSIGHGLFNPTLAKAMEQQFSQHQLWPIYPHISHGHCTTV